MRLGGALPCPANVCHRGNRDARLSRRRGGRSFADRRHGARGDSVGRRSSRLGRALLAGQPHPRTCSLPPVGVSGIRRDKLCQEIGENMKKSDASQGQSPSQLISKRIAELGDWRGETLSRMRTLIKEADPDVVEELKWVKPTNPGIPTWSHDGIICTGETYKSIVKLTFAKGASLNDPARLFNSSLDGNVRRAIDIHEGEEIDANAFKALIRAAVALNSGPPSRSK